jgi:tetratricopeptide (TPR) repeat protein
VNSKIAEQLQHGYKQLQLGRLQEANQCFEAIIKIDPDNEFALNLMGVTLIQQDNPEDAIHFLTNALKVNDSDPETYNNLGLAYSSTNQFDLARVAFENSLRRNPQQAMTLNNLGNVFAATDKHNEAAHAFDAALKIQPDYAECLANFAQALKELEQFGLALKVIKHAGQIDSINSYYINVEGEILLCLAEYEKALITFNRAIALDNNIVASINVSTTLKQLGQYEQAEQHLVAVIKREPQNSEAHNHLGVLQEQRGQFDAAAISFRNALKHTPNHASSFYQLAKLKNQSLDTQEVQKIESLIADKSTPSIFTSSLYFALAVYFDKQGLSVKAFEYYSLAQDIKAKKKPYDTNVMEQYCQAMQHIMPMKEGQIELPEYRPVFVIGMPRSGTSLTEQILATHSAVFGAGELAFISDLVKDAEQQTKNRYPHCLADLSPQQCSLLGRKYKQRLVDRFGKYSMYIDKNPLNFHFVGFIKAILPDAKFIYCKRDPMDNCVSIFKLPFDDNQSYAHQLDGLGHYYRQHERLVEFWQSLYAKDMYQVNYEQMIGNQLLQTQQLLGFLGLDYEPALHNFHATERLVMTPSAEQVRQPIYSSSINSWQKYGDAVQPLQEALTKCS